jgi:hypothetical protein
VPWYEIMWKNIVQPGRLQMIIWPMLIARWIPKATNRVRICNTYCFFHHNNGCKNPLQCYVIRTLPVLLQIEFVIYVSIKNSSYVLKTASAFYLGFARERVLKTFCHLKCVAGSIELRLIHTCHAAPLPFSDSAVSFVKVRVAAGNIRTASPMV